MTPSAAPMQTAAPAHAAATTRPAAPDRTAALTPTARQQLRRGRFWIVLGLILLGSLLLSLLANGMGGSGTPLDATSPGPIGGKALATVLAEQGVAVQQAGTLAELEARFGTGSGADTGSAEGGSEATVLVFDPNGILESTERWQRLQQLPADLVVISPGYFAVRDLGFDAQIADTAQQQLLEASCPAGAARQNLSVLADGSLFRVGDQGIGCFTDEQGLSWMVQRQEADGRLRTLLGGWQAFSNERIIEAGNAALALRLLGGNATLHWYLPSFSELLGEQAPGLAELSPEALPAVMLLLLFTAIAAAIWRGRRFGPLVGESLPVEVPARETMEGRARLYRDAGDADHALDALRLGTLHRLGQRIGLDERVPLPVLIDRLAELTGAGRGELQELLRDARVSNDRELVERSDALLVLEQRLSRSLDTENDGPAQPPPPPQPPPIAKDA